MPKPKPLTFLITAGPTIEDIDPVRFISNRSTGMMGVAVALAALKAGHTTILIHGPLSESVSQIIDEMNSGKARVSKKLRRIEVRSAAQMHQRVMKECERSDVIIMTAAVADYTPACTSQTKLKKSGGELVLKLVSTVDILAQLGKQKKSGQVLIGFALETGEGKTSSERSASALANAHRKLVEKNLDAIILNSPQAMGAQIASFAILKEGVSMSLEMDKLQFAEVLIRLGDQIHAEKKRELVKKA